jgi:hypothetical protein
MEETPALVRINGEGHGVPRPHRRYGMNSKHIFAGVGVATVLALTSPAYAGILGGGAGGGLSGMGGRGIGGMGSLSGQGQLGATVQPPKVRPVIDATKTTAQSTVQNGKEVAGTAAGNVTADAATAKNDVGSSLAATGNPVSATGSGALNAGAPATPKVTPTGSTATPKTGASASPVSGAGAGDAQLNKGATSVTGSASGSLN